MMWPWKVNEKLKAQVQEQAKQVQELRLTVVDILTGTKTIGEDESGNQYTDKRQAVEAIYRKYRNEDEWGCQVLQRIVNHRKSMVLPYGVQPQIAEDWEGDEKVANDTLEFIQAFLTRNNFASLEDVLCRQAEMEGEVLMLLTWDDEGYSNGEVEYDGMPVVSRRLWAQCQWEAFLDSEDPDVIDRIEWKKKDGSKVTLKAGGDWAFAAFNATQYCPDFVAATAPIDLKVQGMPAAAFCLTNCENLDKGMVNWRKVNKYFANLTPFLTSDSVSETQAIQSMVEKSGWKIGKLMIGRDFKLVGPGEDVSEQIYKEVRANAQLISVATGIPIHQLGFPELIGGGRACYSDDTEALTKSGWKNWRDIGDGEEIACYDSKTNEVVFEVPKALHVYDYKGKMVHFKSRGFDIMVTPDHKMWTRHAQKSEPGCQWHKAEAQTFTKGVIREFLTNAPWPAGYNLEPVGVPEHVVRDTQPSVFDADDFVEFLGYFVSEGSTWVKRYKGKKCLGYVVELGQKSGTQTETAMRSCLDRMKLRYGESTSNSDGVTRFKICHSGLWSWLRDNCGCNSHEKRLPKIVEDASLRQLAILARALMDGDGTWERKRKGRNCGAYHTTSSALAEQVQLLMLKLGFTAHLTVHYKAHGNRAQAYRILLTTDNIRQVRERNISREDYDGKVWCYSTRTGLFLTRRNGKVTIQGNTAQEMSDPMEIVSINDMSVWWNFYKDLFTVAIRMVAEKLAGELDPASVEPKLLPSGSQAWDKIEKVWLPAATSGLVSRKLFLSQLPDVDVEAEMGDAEAEASEGEAETWPEGQQMQNEGVYSKVQPEGETTPE